MPHFRLMLHNQFQEGSAELLPPDDTASLGVPSETLDSSTAVSFYIYSSPIKDFIFARSNYRLFSLDEMCLNF